VGRTDLAGKGQHLVGDGHFQVHARLQHFGQQADVALLDMPAVLAQVYRDAVGTGLLCLDGGLDRIRIASTTGLTQGGHMIDIDTWQYTLGMTHCCSPLMEGVCRRNRLRLTSGRSPRWTLRAWRISCLAARRVAGALQSSAAMASSAAPDSPMAPGSGSCRGRSPSPAYQA